MTCANAPVRISRGSRGRGRQISQRYFARSSRWRRDVDLDGCDFRVGYLLSVAERRDWCMATRLHGRHSGSSRLSLVLRLRFSATSRILPSLRVPASSAQKVATNDTKRNAVRQQRARARATTSVAICNAPGEKVESKCDDVGWARRATCN